jgi:hypothetical protein
MSVKHKPEIVGIIDKWTAYAYGPDGEEIQVIVSNDVRVLVEEVERLMAENASLRAQLDTGGKVRFEQ